MDLICLVNKNDTRAVDLRRLGEHIMIMMNIPMWRKHGTATVSVSVSSSTEDDVRSHRLYCMSQHNNGCREELQ